MNRASRWKWAGLCLATIGGAVAIALLTDVIPEVAAGALLYTSRRPVGAPIPSNCTNVAIEGVGVTLRAWNCSTSGPYRGTLVFLHGRADNRASAAGVVTRFVSKGFDVVAYDSRAHGESTGDACTYGYREKLDLKKVIDQVRPGPVVLLGTSLGAAVALQEAPDDRRVAGVVAAEVFSDLRTVARERAWFLPEPLVGRAFAIAEARGNFRVDDVSPVEAARRIGVPVFLIHGTADTNTLPAHSERVFAALAGPKELLLVPGAKHNESLNASETWGRIERWVEAVVARATSDS